MAIGLEIMASVRLSRRAMQQVQAAKTPQRLRHAAAHFVYQWTPEREREKWRAVADHFKGESVGKHMDDAEIYFDALGSGAKFLVTSDARFRRRIATFPGNTIKVLAPRCFLNALLNNRWPDEAKAATDANIDGYT